MREEFQMPAPQLNDEAGGDLPQKEQAPQDELTPADREAMEQAEMRGEVFARVIPPADA
jgi:hypothetical protein